MTLHSGMAEQSWYASDFGTQHVTALPLALQGQSASPSQISLQVSEQSISIPLNSPPTALILRSPRPLAIRNSGSEDGLELADGVMDGVVDEDSEYVFEWLGDGLQVAVADGEGETDADADGTTQFPLAEFSNPAVQTHFVLPVRKFVCPFTHS